MLWRKSNTRARTRIGALKYAAIAPPPPFPFYPHRTNKPSSIPTTGAIEPSLTITQSKEAVYFDRFFAICLLRKPILNTVDGVNGPSSAWFGVVSCK